MTFEKQRTLAKLQAAKDYAVNQLIHGSDDNSDELRTILRVLDARMSILGAEEQDLQPHVATRKAPMRAPCGRKRWTDAEERAAIVAFKSHIDDGGLDRDSAIELVANKHNRTYKSIYKRIRRAGLLKYKAADK